MTKAKKPKKRALSAAEKQQAADYKWYERTFPNPGDGRRKYRQTEWIAAIDARDAVLFRQRAQIRRLTTKLHVAEYQIGSMELHAADKHGCDSICREIVIIDPIDAPWPHGNVLPKVSTKALMHEWTLDGIKPLADSYKALSEAFGPPVQQQMGWWPRYVVAWWHKFNRWLEGK